MSAECCGTGAAREPDRGHGDGRLSVWDVREVRAAAAAAALLVAAFASEAAGVRGFGDVAAVGALLIGGWTFVPDALRGLLRRQVDVGTLMTVAALGAVALGQLTEAAMLAVLFSGSEGLEQYSLARTRRGLRALLSLVPDEVTVQRRGIEVVVPSADLSVGDVLVIRPGQRVATDGVVITGRSTVDLSAITGESVPVEVTVGSAIAAAAINGTGPIEVRATSTVEDNSLSRIVHIVETEQARKGASQRLIANGLRAGRTDTTPLEPVHPTKTIGLAIGRRVAA